MVNQYEGMSITEARKKLTQLPEELEGNAWAMPLTRHGMPVMALMSWELFEAITETMDIMGDRDFGTFLHGDVVFVTDIPGEAAKLQRNAIRVLEIDGLGPLVVYDVGDRLAFVY